MNPMRRIAERMATAATRRAVARRLADLDLTPNHTLRDELDEWVAAHGARLALLTADGSERLTTADLAARAHRWARWAILHGVGRGEPVALVMADRPERVAAWLGLAEAGSVAALLDPALPPEALAAAIGAVGAAHVVVDAPLLPHFEAAAPHLAAMAAVWVFGPHPMAYMRLDEALDDLSSDRLRPADRRPIAPSDEALRLAGSDGTVARVDHRGALQALHAAAAATGIRPDDRLLLVAGLDLADPAAIFAVGMALTVGATAILAPTRPSGEASGSLRPTLLARPTGAAIEPLAGIRLEIAVGADVGSAAPDPADRHTLRWGGGEIVDRRGTILWRDDLHRNASFAKRG